MTRRTPLQRAVSIAGTQEVLARKIGATQSLISSSMSRGYITVAYAPAVELATGITVEALRPDLAWVRVKDPKWPHPNGRPCWDLTKTPKRGRK